MKFIRMQPQGVQTPELTYEKDGKIIVVQGAIHIGSRKFYEKIIDRIKGFNGEVHLEGIVSTTNDTSDKKHLLDGVYKTLASVTNLDYQKTYINKNLCDGRKIFNHDIDDTEIVDEVFSEDALDSLREFSKSGKDKLMNKHILNIGSSPISNLLLLATGSKRISVDNEDIILHQRNRYALDKAFATDNNVYLFWGAKHMDGMNEILLDAGYRITKERWLTVIPTLRLKGNKDNRRETILASISQIEKVLDLN